MYFKLKNLQFLNKYYYIGFLKLRKTMIIYQVPNSVFTKERERKDTFNFE